MINERGRLVDEDSDAAAQAKQMGLVYKGFGRWADPKTGKVTHKSQDGRLIPVQGSEPRGMQGTGLQKKDQEKKWADAKQKAKSGRTAQRGEPKSGLGADSYIRRRMSVAKDAIQRGVLPEPEDYNYLSSEDMYRMANTAIEKNIDSAEKILSDPTFRDKLANSIIEPHVKKYGERYLDAAKRGADQLLQMLDKSFEKKAGRPIQVQDDGAEADYYNQQADKFASQDRGERGLDMDPQGSSDQEKFKAADRAGELPTDGPPGPDTMGSEPPTPLKKKDPYDGITQDPGYKDLINQYADIDNTINSLQDRAAQIGKLGPNAQDRMDKLMSNLSTKKKALRQKISSYEKQYAQKSNTPERPTRSRPQRYNTIPEPDQNDPESTLRAKYQNTIDIAKTALKRKDKELFMRAREAAKSLRDKISNLDIDKNLGKN